MYQHHQHPSGVDGAAERLELARQRQHPPGDGEPAQRSVVVEVGVRGQLPLPYHRPRLPHVDALVGQVERVPEGVPPMRHRAGEYGQHQQGGTEAAARFIRHGCPPPPPVPAPGAPRRARSSPSRPPRSGAGAARGSPRRRAPAGTGPRSAPCRAPGRVTP